MTVNKPGKYLSAIVALIYVCCGSAQAQYAYADSAATYYSLGQAAYAEGKYSTAWSCHEKAAKLDPGNAAIWLALANACEKARNKSVTIVALEKACELNPADYATQWRFVQYNFHYDQYAPIIKWLPELRRHMKDLKGWAYMLGKSYYFNTPQDYVKAKEYLEISLKEEPANGDAAHMIAYMYAKEQNYKDAIPYYKLWLKADVTPQPAHFYEVARMLLGAEEFEAAIEVFGEAVKAGYVLDDAFKSYWAEAYYGAKQPEAAIKIWEEVFSRRPTDLGILDNLVNAYTLAEQYDKAIFYMKKELTIAGKGDNKRYANLLYRIGTAYDKAGDPKNGVEYHELAIKMDPSLQNMKSTRNAFTGG